MTLEIIMMLAIALGGIAVARLLRIDSIWLAFPAGLIGTMAIRGISFTVMYPLGLQLQSKWVFAGICFTLFVWMLIRDRQSIAKHLLLPVGMAALAIVATRVIGLQNLGHSDSKWILIVTRVMQQGDDLSILSDSNVFKRGLIFPLMVALGDQSEFLTSLTPYAYAALMSAGVALAILLLTKYSRRTVLLSVVPLLAVLYTTTMWWRAMFYLNSHLYMGILIAVVALVSLMAIRRGRLEKNEFVLLLMSAYAFGMVRSEGILINLIILLPLLSQPWINRVQMLWLLTVPAVSFTTWITFYDNYILKATHLPWFVVLMALILVFAIPALPWFDWLRQHAMSIGIFALLAVLAVLTVLFPTSMLKGWYSQYVNLVETRGLWGSLFIVLALIFAFTLSKHYTLEHRILLKVSALMFLAFLASKTLDDAAVGKPGLGRIGWADSLNRMWIHIVVILVVTAMASLANKLQPEIASEQKP